MPVEVGSIVEGVVTGITNFGAFVTPVSYTHLDVYRDSIILQGKLHQRRQRHALGGILAVAADKAAPGFLAADYLQPERTGLFYHDAIFFRSGTEIMCCLLYTSRCV